MRVLFLGTGGIGARHAANVRALAPQAEFVAVRASPSEVTERFAMRLVPDLAAGLRASPNFAVVALPPALHGSAARRILEADVDLYIEKPPALRAADLEPAARAAESRGVVRMSGCILRQMPGFRRLREAIAANRLGQVLSASLSVGNWLPDWRPDRDYRGSYSAHRALGGGVIYDLIHELDLARMLLGELQVVSASACLTGVLDADVEDLAEIILRRDKLLVRVHLDYLDRTPHRCGRIAGTDGTAEYDAISGRLSCYTFDKRQWSEPASPEDFAAPAALRAAMAHFIDCAARREPTGQPLSDALRSVTLAERARALAGLG